MKYRVHIYNTKTLHPYDGRSILVDSDKFLSLQEASKLVEDELNEDEAVGEVSEDS